MVRVYCVIRLPFGNSVHRSFSLEEVETIRQTYSKQWKKGPMPKWYMEKTAVIHTAKYLPKSSKFAAIHEAARREEQLDTIDVPDAEIGPRPESVDPDGVDLEYESAATERGMEQAVADDLAWAMDYKLPGRDGSWGGKAGQPLGLLKPKMLRSIIAWAVRQTEDPSGFAGAAELERAASLVLEAKGEAADESAETFGAGNLGPNLPGEVEADRAASGELPLGDKPRRAKSAQSEGH